MSWEYQVISLPAINYAGTEFLDADNSRKIEIERRLNEMGAQDWELVSVTQTGNLVFKRLVRTTGFYTTATTTIPEPMYSTISGGNGGSINIVPQGGLYSGRISLASCGTVTGTIGGTNSAYAVSSTATANEVAAMQQSTESTRAQLQRAFEGSAQPVATILSTNSTPSAISIGYTPTDPTPTSPVYVEETQPSGRRLSYNEEQVAEQSLIDSIVASVTQALRSSPAQPPSPGIRR